LGDLFYAAVWCQALELDRPACLLNDKKRGQLLKIFFSASLR
jgi:hypothetical protein